jgi:hypothetical protein
VDNIKWEQDITMKYSTNHLVTAALLLGSPASLSGFQFATPLVRNQHNVLAASHDIRSKNVISSSLKSGPASTTRLQMSDAAADAAAEAPKEEELKGFRGKVCPLI